MKVKNSIDFHLGSRDSWMFVGLARCIVDVGRQCKQVLYFGQV